MEKKRKAVFPLLYEGTCRFLFSALFGGFLSVVVFCAVMYWGLYEFWAGYWKHSLWLLPVCWGILGIIWFDQMLDLAREIVENFFRERES